MLEEDALIAELEDALGVEAEPEAPDEVYF